MSDDALREATAPLPEEIAALRAPVSRETLDAAAGATAPLPHELLALQRRLREPAPARPLWRPVLVGAALTAALLLGLWSWRAVPEPPPELAATPTLPPAETPVVPLVVPADTVEAPAEEPTALAEVAPVALPPAPTRPDPVAAPLPLRETPSAFNAAITVSGQGEARVLARGEGGSVIALDAGRVALEVDPKGRDRALTIVAGDVSVSVVGTVFAVERAGERVSVEVSRGRVRVQDPRGTWELGAGERWTNAPSSAEAARTYAALAARAASGETGEALWRELAAFEAAWPASPLASEAALLRLNQQAETLPAAQVVAELDAWLARWPAAPGTSEAHWLRATLLRARLKDCERAATSYAVLAGGDGPRAEAAKGWLRDCAGR